MKFSPSKIKVGSVVETVGKPVLYGALGATAGHFAGKGKNIALAAIVGLGAVALGQAKQDWVIPAVVGCAVVTPSSASTATVSGIDGFDSLKTYITDGTSRAKGYGGSFLSNLGLSSVAAKVGLTGIDGDYDQGYMNGVNDSMMLSEGDSTYDDSVSGIGGYPYSEAGTTPKSLEAALANMPMNGWN